MSNITVKFIGKEYTIPEDVLTYIELLNFTDSVQKQLANAFVRKLKSEINRGNVACLDDNVMAPDIEQQVGKFIAKLTEHGIYDRTINDYLRENEGYKLISKVNAAALDEAKRVFQQQISDWIEGYEDAIQKKDASVTGLSFSILSGSFVNHAIYAAMEASKVNEQEKAAAKEYQKDMAELDARLASRKNEDEKQYVANTYIPHMETAITVFSYELLDTYVSDLIKYGKISKDILNYVHIDRSNDLLKNLELSQNKEAVLLKAFEACPYNIAVYMQAMKYSLLDYDTFQTAKVFKQDHFILSFFRENWGEVSYPNKFIINYHCIDIWASFAGKTSVELLRGLTESYATGIINAYSRVADMLNNSHIATMVMGESEEHAILADNSLSKKKAHTYVSEITSENIWDELTIRCGHVDLFVNIKEQVTGTENIDSKKELDAYLEKRLYQTLEGARLSLIQQITERQKYEKQQKEFEAQQKKKKLKTISIVCVSLLAATAIAFFVKGRIEHYQETVVIPRNTYERAVELMENGDFEEAIEMFLTLGDYEDCKALIDECKLEILDDNYNHAVLLMNEGQYEDAISAFSKLAGYKDSSKLIAECQNGIKDSILAEAMKYMEEGRYLAAISTLEKLGGYKDSAEQLLAAKYALANEEMEDGSRDSYEEAISLFKELGDYKDSAELLETVTSLHLQQFEEYKALCVGIGDLSYGSYGDVKVYAQVKSHIRNDEYYIVTEGGGSIKIWNRSNREELIEGEWITIYGYAYGLGDNMTINVEYIVD